MSCDRSSILRTQTLRPQMSTQESEDCRKYYADLDLVCTRGCNIVHKKEEQFDQTSVREVVQAHLYTSWWGGGEMRATPGVAWRVLAISPCTLAPGSSPPSPVCRVCSANTRFVVGCTHDMLLWLHCLNHTVSTLHNVECTCR